MQHFSTIMELNFKSLYLLTFQLCHFVKGQMNIKDPRFRRFPPDFGFKQPNLFLEFFEDPTPEFEGKTGNLSCYSCSLDFRYGYENLNPCLGLHGEKIDPDYLEKCGVKDAYCLVERVEVNGVLTTLTRSCTDSCYFGCRPRGFGIYIETCADCCNTNACNDFYPIIDDGGPTRGADGKLLREDKE